MTRRTIQKEKTRSAIVDAAHYLFSRNGFPGVSTAAIAKRAGVSHGSVFAHFAGREDLIMAVIERFGEAVVLRMHELAEARVSLRAMLGAHLQCLGENERLYAHLMRDLFALPRQAVCRVIAIQSGISFHISKAAEIEARRGTIKPVAPDLLFNTWIGLIHYYLMNRELFVADASASVIETHGPRLLDHFMTLISIDRKED